MTVSIDLDQIDRLIRATATEEVMPRFRKLAAGDVEMKGAFDPVTIADREAERVLTARLLDALPGSVAIGEESFAGNPAIMARLCGNAPVWILDPIDGTRNFVAGKPEFAVMVALVIAGQPVAGWIHDPNSGDTLMAEQGGGVWLRGQRLQLAAQAVGTPLVGLIGARMRKLITEANLLLQGQDNPVLDIGSCAAFDYARLFAGPVTFANAKTSRAGFLVYRQVNVWDHAAGYLMHREAGGYSADLTGQPYNLNQPRHGLLFAPNEAIWHRLHEVFQPLLLSPPDAR